VWRSFPEQRANPLAIGQKVTVSARRIHSLPTPITSFTVIAREQAAAESLRDTPLLATLASRMQTRITMRTARTTSAPPGMPVLAAAPDVAATVLWNLVHGASQVFVVPVGAHLPARIVVLLATEGGTGPLGVAASLLRHVPAESVLLAIHDAATPERERAARLRLLLDARSVAQSEHGLDLRTELRFGDLDAELDRELAVEPNSMLVIGLHGLDGAEAARIKALLGGTMRRPVLIVRTTEPD
jgi:sulfate/thiosulfate transport system ATP-binding protein